MKCMYPLVKVEANSPESGEYIPSRGSFSGLPKIGGYRLSAEKDLLCMVAYIDTARDHAPWHAYLYVDDDELYEEGDWLPSRSEFFNSYEEAVKFCDDQLRKLGYKELEPKHLNFL